MSLTVATIRQRIASAVDAVASPLAMRPSRWDLALHTEPLGDAHGAYAVLVRTTAFTSPVEASRRTRTAGDARTQLVVRWLFRLRADAFVSDYDAALAAEAAIYQAVTGTTTTDVHVHVLDLTRDVVADGTFLRGEIAVRADHTLALS